MRKITKIALILLALVMIVSSTAILAACKDNNDPMVLNVVALNAGYGKEWLETIAAKFEADHPGYTVNLDNVIYEAPTLINTHINSKNNVDDLYISVGNSWKTYAAQGKFASLDDLMEDTVDGVKIKDKVASAFVNSIYFPNSSGEMHTYRLPWTGEIGGIYYNKTMFEENGWQVPETYEQLLALCQQIVDDQVTVTIGGRVQNVTPFVYTGENIDYFDYTVYTWWAQLSGEENIRDFMEYNSPDNWDSSKKATYNNLKKATEMWQAIFGNSDYVMPNSDGMSNHTAQTNFANGYAAMMFNGGWIYNEILDYQINNDFQLALMKTPTATDAIEDIVYTIGEDQYIAIPATSTKQDLAKDFIKLMVSDYGCEVFLNQAHGVLAYKSNITAANVEDAYLKNMLEVKNGYSKAFTDYPTVTATENVLQSNKLLWLSNLINIWGVASLRPYGNLVGTGAKSVDEAFGTIATEISRQWSTWRTSAGLQ